MKLEESNKSKQDFDALKMSHDTLESEEDKKVDVNQNGLLSSIDSKKDESFTQTPNFEKSQFTKVNLLSSNPKRCKHCVEIDAESVKGNKEYVIAKAIENGVKKLGCFEG